MFRPWRTTEPRNVPHLACSTVVGSRVSIGPPADAPARMVVAAWAIGPGAADHDCKVRSRATDGAVENEVTPDNNGEKIARRVEGLNQRQP